MNDSKTFKSAADLGLPTGEAVIRRGKVTQQPTGLQPIDRSPAPIRPATISRIQPDMPTGGSQVILKTTYIDRSKGFLISSVPLWLAFATAAGLICYFYRGNPFLSVAMIGYLFTGAALGWFGSWAIHTIISPDGNTFYQSWLAYRIIQREQDHRHAQEENFYHPEEEQETMTHD